MFTYIKTQNGSVDISSSYMTRKHSLTRKYVNGNPSPPGDFEIAERIV
jgi:hypothetical protein